MTLRYEPPDAVPKFLEPGGANNRYWKVYKEPQHAMLTDADKVESERPVRGGTVPLSNGKGAYDLQALRELVRSPRTPREMQFLADRLITRINADTTVLSPRIGKEISPVLPDWMVKHKDRFLFHLTNLLVEASDDPVEHRLSEARKIAERVYPDVESELHRYAVERAALRWCARTYPQGAELDQAYRDQNLWVVPVVRWDSRKQIGQIVLDIDGNVMAERTSDAKQLRQEFASVA